jgi:arginase
VTGRGPTVLTDIEGRRPLVRDEDVALVGYRVIGDNDHFGAEQIRETAINVMDLAEVRERGVAERATELSVPAIRPSAAGAGLV